MSLSIPKIAKSLVLLLLSSILLGGYVSVAAAIGFNANWFYRQSGGDRAETRDEFRQRYSLGVGPTFSYQPTHAISASAAISYSRSEFGDERGTTGGDSLTPAGRFNLLNDIFQFGLSGSSSGPASGGPRRNSWDATLGSQWSAPLVPNIRLNYSERTETLEGGRFFGDEGEKETDFTASVNWDLILANLSYSYTRNRSEGIDSDAAIQTEGHFGRFSTDGSFWDNRFFFNFAQAASFNTSEVTVGGTGDGPVDVPIGGDALFAVTAVPVPEPALGDTLEVTFDPFAGGAEVPFGEQVHFLVDVFEPETVDLLRLTLDTDDPSAGELQWDLYVLVAGDPEGGETTWELAVENLPAVFDPLARTLDIAVGSNQQTFMIAAVNLAAASLTFTSVEAIGRLTEGRSSSSTNYLTNFGMRYRITSNLLASVNLTYSHNESDFAEFRNERDRIGGNGVLRWTPVTNITTSLAYNEFRELPAEGQDEISRNYGLTVSTYPLPKMNVAFGATLSEREIGEQRTFTSNRYSVVARAPIYPDLDAVWNFAYTESERLTSEDTFEDTTVVSSSLNLTARLHPYVTADSLLSFSRVTPEDEEPRQTGDLRLGIRYRPSDLLAMRGNYRTRFGDNVGDDDFSLGLILRLLHTTKARLNLTANHIQSGQDTIDNFGLSGNWDISRNLSLRGRANYNIAEFNTYNFSFNLNFRL